MDFPSRVCSKCGVDKDLRQFSPDKRASEGRRTVCKGCVAVSTKAARRRRMEETWDLPSPDRRCPACERTLPTTEFNRMRGGKDGLQCYCRSCAKKKYPAGRYEGRY